jgi:hypothetical protein
MKIHCAYDELVEIEKLKPHPKNRNKHSKEQIERLAKIIEYQGIRRPLRVSKLTGLTTAGHGLLKALRTLGCSTVPVNYQDYENEDQEYADIIADNSIASWAELDFSSINLDIPELGPDFDIEVLGIKNFFLDASEKGTNPNEEWQGMPEFNLRDKTAFRSLVVHFHNQEGLDQFEKATKQNITNKTRMIWYPEIIIEKALDKRYGGES